MNNFLSPSKSLFNYILNDVDDKQRLLTIVRLLSLWLTPGTGVESGPNPASSLPNPAMANKMVLLLLLLFGANNVVSKPRLFLRTTLIQLTSDNEDIERERKEASNTNYLTFVFCPFSSPVIRQ